VCRVEQIPRVRVRDELLIGDGIPGVERGHSGQQPHRPPVRTHRVVRTPPAGVFVRPGLTPREHDRGGKPLEVPLPRAEHGLVEVVQIDDQTAPRIAVQPEIGRMCIAAELGAHPGHRRPHQVVGHQPGRTAQERERCGSHPPHPDRREAGHSAPVRLLDRTHGVGPTRWKDQRIVRDPGHPVAQRLARPPRRPWGVFRRIGRASGEPGHDRYARLIPHNMLHRHCRFEHTHGAQPPHPRPTSVRTSTADDGTAVRRQASAPVENLNECLWAAP
jgi:hypothetical protein